MNSFVVSPRTKAFTLVELLVVIAIIGILAAMLLPVLNQGQQRAQRAFCENNLQQIGLAFHVFANDHAGKFPMAVSTNEGGAMELVQVGLDDGGTFYTAFRSFLPLGGELVNPSILKCPSDMRAAALYFSNLQNSNLSYFVGANGNFDKPGTILAGDRNLETNAMVTPTILGIGRGIRLHWTAEMHQYRGNILFADGHAEEWNNPGLVTGANSLPDNENLLLPSAVATVYYQGGPGSYGGSGGSSGSSGGGSGSSYGANSSSATAPMARPSGQLWSQSPSQPAPPPMADQPGSMPGYSQAANNEPNRAQAALAKPDSSVTAETNPAASPLVATAAPVASVDLAMSPFDRHLTKTLQHTFEWSYLLLLLLVLVYLMYRLRKRTNEKEAWRRWAQEHEK